MQALEILKVVTESAGGQLWAQSYLSVPKIRELVPESQAYMDLLAFERKLDQTIMRKRLDIQEALKRPIKVTQQSRGRGSRDGTGTFTRLGMKNQRHSTALLGI